MDPEQYKLIQQAVNKSLALNPWFLLLLSFIAAGLGSYAAAYLKTKGKNLATKEDFDQVLDQLKRQTAATEEIKGKVAEQIEGVKAGYQESALRLQNELSSDTQRQLAGLTNTLSRETLSESRLEQHVFESLNYFSGRTQRRSIGLAVIQANWDKMPHLHSTWVSVLVAQAVYLLSEVDRKDTSEHEVTNLNNIRSILQRQDVLWDDQVRELKRALEARSKGKGLGLTEDDLKLWEEFVSKMQTKLVGGNA